MGFGFSDISGPEDVIEKKELPHSLRDVLKYQNPDDLYAGQKVQSVLTSVEGFISDISKSFGNTYITIKWNNGNESYAKKGDLGKVIII